MRNRIVELAWLLPSELTPHPLNWRTHGEYQREVFREILETVGIVGALIAYREGSKTILIDGHLRLEEATPDERLPVIITDLTSEEAAVALATFDPIGEFAEADLAVRDDLTREVTASFGLVPGSKVLEMIRGAASVEEEAKSAGERQKPDKNVVRFGKLKIPLTTDYAHLVEQSIECHEDAYETLDDWADILLDRLLSQQVIR